MRRSLAIACFFLSGFAGLVYEICWIRTSALVFGSTTYALSTVLAVFFFGMAVGNWIFGRIGMRIRRPIRLYAILEISLGILAILSIRAFPAAEDVFGSIYRSLVAGGGLVSPDTTGLILLRVLLVSVILLPPTILMGGTLPLFCRQFVVSKSGIAGMVGLLYGINTLGAAAGAALTGFVLLPRIGVTMSIVAAAAVNLVAALVAMSLKLESGEAEGPQADRAQRPDTADRPRAVIVAVLFFGTGLVALGAEIVWTRFLSLIVRNSVYTYSITLTVVLIGIVLGSLLASRLFDRRLPLAVVFGLFQIVAALLILVLMWLPVSFWRDMGEGWGPFLALMLAPAVLSGASFPLAIRLILDDPRRSSRIVGRMTAVNILGGILGSLLAGFYLLPVHGLAFSTQAVSLAGVVSGSLALLCLDRRGPMFRRGALARTLVVPAALLVWLLLPRLANTDLPADYLAPRGALVDFKEGRGSTLAAVKKDGSLNLHIDRLWQGKDLKSHQIMAAHVPMMLAPDVRDVLVIGVGVGQTAARFLYHDIEHLDCVDIEPEIFDFIDANFDTRWMRDPRTTLIADDGRSFSTHTDRRYDLVSIEVGQVFRPGVETFYTREFYGKVRGLLRPGGLVAQFVPIGFLEEPEFRAILATLLEVFPDAALWYNTNELLLIGGADAAPKLGPRRLASLRENAVLREDLRWSHWGGEARRLNRAPNFLAGFLASGGPLRALADGGRILEDDLPVLSYATRTAIAAGRRDARLARLIRTHLSPLSEALSPGVAMTDADLRSAEAMRERNLDDLEAASFLRTALERLDGGGPRAAIAAVQRALDVNPESFMAHRMMGEILNLSRRQGEAIPWLRTAVDMRPHDRLAPRDLALALLQTGAVGEAETLLRSHLQRWPRDAAAHNYLGAALAETGRVAEARDAFRRAVTLDPHDSTARENLERADRVLQGGRN